MAHRVACMNSEQGCVMFDCLVHLWEWLDPPVLNTSPSMESKNSAPATQQPHLMPHHAHPTSNHQNHLHLHNHNSAPVTDRLNSPQPYQLQPNGIVHQLLMQNPSTYQTNLQQMSNSSSDARSPLLQNQQELYGTRQTVDYNRQYGANDNYPYTQTLETRTEHIQPSNHNINQDIMHAIPKGYNAEVYQDYMKRNPPKETNQIYQNHQTYQPNVSQYTNKPYLPYTHRIQPPTQSNTELLRRQYTEIQQMKLQQQMHYQNQAQMQQQQTFAERQLLLQQMHGIQPAPNLQQSIYSDGYKESDRYNMMSQQSERDDRFKPQSPNSDDYQTQPQVKQSPGPMSPMKSSADSNSPNVKSPTSSESRRSSGGNQALRSPVAQRPASAPVTISGILYKQGSDGLKVWRKRWFVLAEYCLFYYKSEQEGKLLGSVLLPSYRVSACGAEERALRKFAFKLSHANMRTYVLAAPDHQQMTRWVKALTAASTMQDVPRVSEQQADRKQTISQENEEEEDEVPGPTYANAPPKPRRSNDGYNSPSSDIYDPNYDLLQKPASHYSQSNQNRYAETNHPTTMTTAENGFDRNPQSPLYDHYSTKRSYDAQILSLPLTNTATDRLENQNPRSLQYKNESQPSHYDNRARSHQQQQRLQEQKLNDEILSEQIYGRNQTQNLIYSKEKSVDADAPSHHRNAEERINKNEIPQADTQANFDPNIYNRDTYSEKINKVGKTSSSDRLPIERRTPDAYGRSNVISYNRAKTSDYEDVYPAYSGENEYGMSYSKPTNPASFAEKKNVPATPGYPAKYSSNPSQGFSGPSVLRRKKMQSNNPAPNVQRPHSADFLEYEAKQELNKTLPSRAVCEPTKQPQRPKSSLDINSYYDPSSDRYYSEESYAEKMRQSAQYLQQRGLSTKDFQVPLAKYTSGLAQKQLDSYTHNLNNNYESGYDAPKDNVSYNSKYGDLEALNSNWTLKEKTQKDYLNRTGSAVSDGSNVSPFVRESAQRSEAQVQESFMRSSSARLPSAAAEGNNGERKVQQREESMKRLLEWKQRMLQSPLTRKSTPASISLARSLNQSRQAAQNRVLDQSKQKSSTYTNASYNSYSSDDEDQASDIVPHVREKQAGRSQNNSLLRPRIPQEHPPSLPHRNTKVTSAPDSPNSAIDRTYENICTQITYTVQNNTPNKDEEIVASHEKNSYDCFERPRKITTPVKNNDELKKDNEFASPMNDAGPELTDDSEAESEIQMEYTDDDLNEVLYQSDTELRNKRQENSEVDTLKTNKVESEEDKPETPPAVVLEDHYLPMSPRKTSSSLEPAHQNIIKHLSVFDKSRPPGLEDSPYVEMGLGNELDDEMQTYEIVCVNNGKVEPLYMELSNLTSGSEGNGQVNSPTPTVFTDTTTNFANTKDLTLKRPGKEEKIKDECKSPDVKVFTLKNQKSDCSDADDEASKELSLSLPFNRFSISDNFRPASYYLRGSRNLLDLQDSSDSEIVSPPPIPATTPPLDEMTDDLSKYVLDRLDRSNLSEDNSILKLLTSDEHSKLSTVKRKTTSLMIYGSRPSIHDTLFRGEKIRHSRASLNDKLKDNQFKNNSLLSNSFLQHYNSNRSIETDSLMSYNADRGSSRMSTDSDISSKFDKASNISSERASLNESEAGIEFRNLNMSQQDMEKMMKRRPLSDDSFFDIDSLESSHANEAIGNVDLDRYLDNLQNKPEQTRSGRPSTDNCLHKLKFSSIKDENSTGIAMQSSETLVKHTDKMPPISHGRSASTPVGKSLATGKAEMTENLSSIYKGTEQRSRYNTGSLCSTSSVGPTTTPISYYSKNYDEESTLNKNLNHAFSADKIKEFDGHKIALKMVSENTSNSNAAVSHSRESSTEHSAPYYYSDLSSQEHINVLPTSTYLKNTNANRKLNNQRRRGPLNKKNEISHIHNPIHNTNQPHFTTDRTFELAVAARCVSVEFLSAADKNPEIDMKNIYESTSLKTPKIRDSMSSLQSDQSFKNTSSTPVSNDIELPCTSANPSRSFDRTISSMDQEENNKDSSKSSENSSGTVFNATEPDSGAYDTLVCEGDMLWDEDALWRDKLRRASHRHARSMDDIDVLPAETHRPGRCSVDLSAMKKSQTLKKENKKKKITRNVIYVNSDIQNQVLVAVKRSDKSEILDAGPTDDTKFDENDVYVSLACGNVLQEHSDEGVYEQLTVESSSDASAQSSLKDLPDNKKKKFEIDRENLRQWDFMSSGLMKNGGGTVVGQGAGKGTGALTGHAEPPSTDSGADSASNEASVSISGAGMGPNVVTSQAVLAKKSFLGSNTSIGRSNRDNNIPVRAVSPRVRWTEEKPGGTYGSQQISSSQQNLSTINMVEDSWATGPSPSRMSQQPIRAVSPRVRRYTDSEDRSELPAISQPAQNAPAMPTASVEQLMNDNLTAGELLGRTHEELVLLLIQLRRRHTATHQAMEQCAAQMHNIKDCLSSLTAAERQESLQRLEQLKRQLMELEQQYEKSKPLVHLVDNMVKLGSLYNRPAGSSTIEKLERNQRLRQKVLAEQAVEQRRWAEGKVGDPDAARARVEELWALERELTAEAATLHGLKADKEAIETLLTGVRSKFGQAPPSARAPRHALEADLARVHAMLAHNSKKLEQTVADNARLERELLSLRRALHTHRQTPAAHTPSHTPTTALLEDEVARVQQLVQALQRQRQELSRAVRHLTHQSRALHTGNVQPAPEQLLYAPGSVKRRPQSAWLETDIDSGHCVEHGLEDYDYDSSVSMTTSQYDTDALNMQPLYVDTLGVASDAMSPLTSDDITSNGLNTLTNIEKQEIKTVRIVKRESERRQRDRERSIQPNTDWTSSNISVDLDHLLEEEFTPHYTNRSTSLPRTQQYTQDYYSKNRSQPPNYLRLSNVNVPEINSMDLSPKFPSSPSLSNYEYSRDVSSSYNRSYDSHGLSLSSQFLDSPTDSSRTLTNDPLSKTSSIGSLSRNAELSPIFKSEAAKQIITEMSGDGPIKNSSSLHRRQIPKEKRRHYTAPHHLSAKTLSEIPNEYYNQEKMGRSLDDADMERALRAPPDVVRSALAPQRYAESTIDQLLLAPRKIVIPERYIPEKPAELSPEEQKKRLEKVESIKKMLSSSNGSDPTKSPEGEEKRQRDHLLQMNQILARQVMEMSKIVAVKALENTPQEEGYDSEDRSPDVELPLYQQRDNFFT